MLDYGSVTPLFWSFFHPKPPFLSSRSPIPPWGYNWCWGTLCRSSGCFLKWWYPQNTPKWSFLVGKPIVVGYHHFRKPPYKPNINRGFPTGLWFLVGTFQLLHELSHRHTCQLKEETSSRELLPGKLTCPPKIMIL